MTADQLIQVLRQVPGQCRVRLGQQESPVICVSLFQAVGKADRPYSVLHLSEAPVEDWVGQRVLWLDPDQEAQTGEQ